LKYDHAVARPHYMYVPILHGSGKLITSFDLPGSDR